MADEVAHSNNQSTGVLDRPPYASALDQSSIREASVARLQLVWNHRQFISRLTIMGLILSVVVAFLIPRKYQSTTRLMPPDQSNSGLAMLAAAAGSQAGASLSSGLGAVAGDVLGLKNSGDLFVGVLQSRTVQDDVINKFDLRKLYRDKLWEDARDDLAKNTDVSVDRKSGILAIQVTDKSPQRAAAMAQEYVEELNRVVTEVNTSSAHRERVFLEERLSQVRQDLESAEQGFSQFASKNTAIDIQAQGKAMIDAAATLEGQLIGAETELQGLKQVYSNSNVRVRAIQARIDELQLQLHKLSGKSDIAAESDPSAYPSLRALPLLGVDYADLLRGTKVQEAIFGTLIQEYELARVQEAKETPSVKVIDPPYIPGKKSFPPRLLIILVGTILTFSAAVIVVIGNARWQEIDPDDPGRLLMCDVINSTKTRIPWVWSNGHLNAQNGKTRGLIPQIEVRQEPKE